VMATPLLGTPTVLQKNKTPPQKFCHKKKGKKLGKRSCVHKLFSAAGGPSFSERGKGIWFFLLNLGKGSGLWFPGFLFLPHGFGRSQKRGGGQKGPCGRF